MAGEVAHRGLRGSATAEGDGAVGSVHRVVICPQCARPGRSSGNAAMVRVDVPVQQLAATFPAPRPTMPRPRTRFLVVGMARSGTTVVHQALQGHPNVRTSMDEIKVAPFFTTGYATFTVSGDSPFEQENGYGILVDALTMLPCHERGPALLGLCGTDEWPKREPLANGVRVAIGNAQEAETLVAALQRFPSLLEFAIVRVHRNDLVAQCASLRRAQRTGRWHSFRPGKPTVRAPEAPFEIPTSEFATFCDDARRTIAALDKLADSHRVLELSYEDEIATHGTAGQERLFRFLGLPWIEPNWITARKVAPPVEDYVTNAAALRTWFAAHVPPRYRGLASAMRRSAETRTWQRLNQCLEEGRRSELPSLLDGVDELENLGLAHYLRQLGEIDLARKAACLVASTSPEYQDAQCLRAELCLEHGPVDELQGILAGIRTVPNLNLIYQLRGRGHHEAAARLLDRVDPNAPDFVQALLLKAEAMLNAGQYDEADSVLAEARARPDAPPGALLRSAWLRFRQQRLEEAVAFADQFDAVLARIPEPATWLVAGRLTMRANLLCAQGRPKEAVPLLEKLVQLEPGNADHVKFLTSVREQGDKAKRG